MSHEHHSSTNNQGFWYTYFGKGGAAAFAFLWILITIIWIFGVVKWG
ncbi:MAG: hypothetical protein IPJ66_12890 [Bacteroidetes bacterium]|nr:hypothetical protein [Bacteroidota bacterium]MBL0064099.1 hypothetical protein [Bacteroidota bacterium]MBL0139517.1 hypothetical protein [Bacteroidota bacterium]